MAVPALVDRVQRPQGSRRSNHMKKLTIIVTLLLILVSCRNTPAGRQPAATQSPSTQVDAGRQAAIAKLKKSSPEELRQALDNRRDKTVYSAVPDDLKNVSDKELIDHLRERQKTIYDHDRRLDYPEFASNGDYARVAESVAAFISPDQYHIDGKELRITAKSLSATRSVCSDQ